MSHVIDVREPRDALDHGPRPDPALGVFETLAVIDGALPALDAHLERLARSATELYGLALDPGLAARLRLEARGHDGRLRVTLWPDGRIEVGRAQRGAPPDYSAIAPFVLPGGLGPHKWCDRRLLDAIAAQAAPDGLPLLIDAGGEVLEASWANVLIEERGVMISPLRDGRFRAGVGRTRHEFRQEPVDLERLRRADAVLLTSALRDLWLGRAPGSSA